LQIELSRNVDPSCRSFARDETFSLERNWTMTALIRTNRRRFWTMVALATGFSFACDSAAPAGDDVAPCPAPCAADGSNCGILGSKLLGPGPGYQGFGLNFHPGYGYGGAALGVGPEGGYPFYGGPGYPHAEPRLRRFPLLHIVPFPYFGGPGYPTPECPNFFA
jgi:hypothetical protein